MLRSCRYGREVIYGHAYQLERKLHGRGERREKWARSRREKETTVNIKSVIFLSIKIAHFLLNFTILRKRGDSHASLCSHVVKFNISDMMD